MRDQPPLMQLAYSVEQAAAVLNLGSDKVRTMVKSGRLHSLRDGGRIVVPLWAIEKLLSTPEDYRHNVTPIPHVEAASWQAGSA